MYLWNSHIPVIFGKKWTLLEIWLRKAAKNNNIWHTQCLNLFKKKKLGNYAKYYQHVKSFYFINLKFV